jgi:CPA1 family monovalent cation:H+ antiporter
MRGVVSLAAALSLPLTIGNGEPFPYRNLLIFLTIVVIAFSLFVQGGTLPAVIKMLKLDPEEDNREETERMVRLKLTREAIRALDEAATREGLDRSNPTFQRVVNTYVYVATLNMVARDEAENEMVTKLELIAVDSQRKVLLDLRDKNEIDEGLFQQLQNELDLADMHIRAITLPAD